MAVIGFEEKLWAAADKLRNNMDSGEYKHVVLGLIFLKYVSDSFNEKWQELMDLDPDFAEDRDAYMAEGIFGYHPMRAGLLSQNMQKHLKLAKSLTTL